MNQLSRFSQKHYAIMIAIAIALYMTIGNTYEAWKKRDGWCMQINQDGSQQIMYGKDCPK